MLERVFHRAFTQAVQRTQHLQRFVNQYISETTTPPFIMNSKGIPEIVWQDSRDTVSDNVI